MWAVGYSTIDAGEISSPLAEHWNASTRSVIAVPARTTWSFRSRLRSPSRVGKWSVRRLDHRRHRLGRRGAPRPDLNAILVVDSQRYGRLTGRPFQAAGSRNSRSTHIPRRIHAKRFHAAVLANRGSGRPQALGIGILVNSRTWSLFQASLSSETAHPQRPRIKKPPPPRSRTTRMMMMMISSTALTSLRHPGRIAYDP